MCGDRRMSTGERILLSCRAAKKGLRSLGTQFRIHDSQDCAILLDIPSHPIIERCTEMRFGGYPDHSIDDGGMEESARRPVSDGFQAFGASC